MGRHWMGMVPVLVGLAACCFSPPPGGRGAATASPPPPVGPATPVTACEVDDAYRANEIAGQQQYPEGTHVLVSGTVDAVTQTFGTMAIRPRRCMLASVRLADDQAAAAAGLRPGDHFQADCSIGHYIMGADFDGCRIVP